MVALGEILCVAKIDKFAFNIVHRWCWLVEVPYITRINEFTFDKCALLVSVEMSCITQNIEKSFVNIHALCW